MGSRALRTVNTGRMKLGAAKRLVEPDVCPKCGSVETRSHSALCSTRILDCVSCRHEWLEVGRKRSKQL